MLNLEMYDKRMGDDKEITHTLGVPYQSSLYVIPVLIIMCGVAMVGFVRVDIIRALMATRQSRNR